MGEASSAASVPSGFSPGFSRGVTLMWASSSLDSSSPPGSSEGLSGQEFQLILGPMPSILGAVLRVQGSGANPETLKNLSGGSNPEILSRRTMFGPPGWASSVQGLSKPLQGAGLGDFDA